MRRIVLALVALALVAGCAGQSEVAGDRRNVGSVTVTFTAKPARVEVGRPVVLTLRLTNNAGREAKLDFAGPQYDFWITEDEDEIWRWSDERETAAVADSQTIAPQSSVTFSENWTAERPGTFTAFGVVEADGYDRSLQGKVTVGD
jgi:hypothetical protein